MSIDLVGATLEHPVFGKLLPCYSQIISQCTSKYRSDKSIDLKSIEDTAQRLTTAIQTDAKRPVPAERFLALLTYVAELSWSFLYRTTEKCGPESAIIKTFRIALMQLQSDHMALSCTKGIEMVSHYDEHT